eukprot:4769186-Pleurochrysis_carterae.AAC.1
MLVGDFFILVNVEDGAYTSLPNTTVHTRPSIQGAEPSILGTKSEDTQMYFNDRANERRKSLLHCAMD